RGFAVKTYEQRQCLTFIRFSLLRYLCSRAGCFYQLARPLDVAFPIESATIKFAQLAAIVMRECVRDRQAFLFRTDIRAHGFSRNRGVSPYTENVVAHLNRQPDCFTHFAKLLRVTAVRSAEQRTGFA